MKQWLDRDSQWRSPNSNEQEVTVDGSFISGFLSGIFIGQAALTIALMLLANLNRNDNGGE